MKTLHAEASGFANNQPDFRILLGDLNSRIKHKIKSFVAFSVAAWDCVHFNRARGLNHRHFDSLSTEKDVNPWPALPHRSKVVKPEEQC